jgi:hypothetical protein
VLPFFLSARCSCSFPFPIHPQFREGGRRLHLDNIIALFTKSDIVNAYKTSLTISVTVMRHLRVPDGVCHDGQPAGRIRFHLRSLAWPPTAVPLAFASSPRWQCGLVTRASRPS